VLQNTTAETNVKLTDLTADHYKCRILFENKNLGYLDFNMFFSEPGNEVTWNIKKNNKGKYVTRFVSAVPVAKAPPAPANQTVVMYSPTAPAATTTTTVQQTQTTGRPDDVNINVGINASGQGGNISIQASGIDDRPSSGYSTTTTTTTTTTKTVTTATSGAPAPQPAPMPVSPPPPVVYVPGYTGKIGCPVPLNPAEFTEMKESIRSKDFENTRLTVAKQIINNNCLTASQVKELLGLLDFENSRLEFAKYAYHRTYDIGNYYKVNDAFEFEHSVEELNEYINSQK
jgi:hypothetical protein